ncbi:phage tail protein [Psychromonas hadalis]|uniref:phage tail-collar fiber domain-containing protein n=1 Tax=Psychromonas hadalis TaxID=211669 RepID=UPI0003B569FC|nr:phage tail protein [Psychromonas hadalis]
MSLIITEIGLEKAMQADEQGVSFKITHVGVGLNGYTPDKKMSALQNEFKRVEIAGGTQVAGNQIHLTALFDGDEEINGRELGFYLKDGTLFAIESHPTNLLTYKSPSSKVIEAFDLILEGVPPNSITVDSTGDLSLYYADTFAVMGTAQINNMRRTLSNLVQLSELKLLH